MRSLRSTVGDIFAASFIGLLFFGNSAFAQFVPREQIVQALTMQPALLSLADRLRNNRSLTLGSGNYDVASAQTKPTIELHEIYFEFNSATVTADAEPQLRELGAALRDPR